MARAEVYKNITGKDEHKNRDICSYILFTFLEYGDTAQRQKSFWSCGRLSKDEGGLGNVQKKKAMLFIGRRLWVLVPWKYLAKQPVYQNS